MYKNIYFSNIDAWEQPNKKKQKRKASAGGPDAQDKPTNQKRKTKNKKQKKQKEKQKKNNGGLVLCKNGSKKTKPKMPHVSIFEKFVLYTRFNIIFICFVVLFHMKNN